MAFDENLPLVHIKFRWAQATVTVTGAEFHNYTPNLIQLFICFPPFHHELISKSAPLLQF